MPLLPCGQWVVSGGRTSGRTSASASAKASGYGWGRMNENEQKWCVDVV